jgi:hypothetical protein
LLRRPREIQEKRNNLKRQESYSEPQLGKEPPVLSRLEAILQPLLGILGSGDLLVPGLEALKASIRAQLEKAQMSRR